MGLRNIFARRPKVCTGCSTPGPGLHTVWSGLRKGSPEAKLCTTCLLRQLEERLPGRSVLFIEPLTSDSYVYELISELPAGEVRDRITRALQSRAGRCADCFKASEHLWVPQSDLDFGFMKQLPASGYYSIPKEAANWLGARAFCSKHAVEFVRTYLEEHRYFFLTVRFPEGSGPGYYW